MENDYCTVARLLEPTNAQLIRSCLRGSGILAVVADYHHAQAHFLLIVALGGVRVLVRNSEAAMAHEILAAFHCGELALPNDIDVGAELNVDNYR